MERETPVPFRRDYQKVQISSPEQFMDNVPDGRKGGVVLVSKSYGHTYRVKGVGSKGLWAEAEGSPRDGVSINVFWESMPEYEAYYYNGNIES